MEELIKDVLNLLTNFSLNSDWYLFTGIFGQQKGDYFWRKFIICIKMI